MKRSKIPLLYALAVLILLDFSTCVTKMEMPEMKDPVKPAKTTLEIGYSLGNMRVDLFRQTKTSTSFVEGRVIATTENVAWHPLVARLGNGIIIDANFNICLDLVEVLGLAGAENYAVSGTSKLMVWDIRETQKKAGKTMDFKREGFISSSTRAVDSGESIEISDTLFSGKGKEYLRIHPDAIDWVPAGIFPDLLKSTIRKEGNKVLVPGFLFNSAIEQTDETTVRVNNYLEIINDGSRIAIRFHNLFGESTAWLDFYKNGLTYTRGKDLMAVEFDDRHCSVVWPYTRMDLDVIRN